MAYDKSQNIKQYAKEEEKEESSDVRHTNHVVLEPHEVLGGENEPELLLATLEDADVVERQPTLADNLNGNKQILCNQPSSLLKQNVVNRQPLMT